MSEGLDFDFLSRVRAANTDTEDQRLDKIEEFAAGLFDLVSLLCATLERGVS
jgi:hypothetical protein